MKWKRGSKYHLESACGRYTISRMDSADGAKYVAWRRGKPMATWLGLFDDGDTARAFVAQYAKEAA